MPSHDNVPIYTAVDIEPKVDQCLEEMRYYLMFYALFPPNRLYGAYVNQDGDAV